VPPPASATAGSAETGCANSGSTKTGSGAGAGSAGAARGAARGAAGGAAVGSLGAECSCEPDPASAAVGSTPSSAAATCTSGEAVAATSGEAGAATVVATELGAGVVVVDVVDVVVGAGAATVAAGAGACGGVADGGGGVSTGRNESGSTYPCGSEVTRTPRYTYGASSSGVPLGPTVPTASPSATLAPFFTTAEPRCVSVTEYPSPVAMVTLRPLVGTLPANVTVPDAGATTVVPAPEPMSMPRCCPPAYG
jgi:hypothetical protein